MRDGSLSETFDDQPPAREENEEFVRVGGSRVDKASPSVSLAPQYRLLLRHSFAKYASLRVHPVGRGSARPRQHLHVLLPEAGTAGAQLGLFCRVLPRRCAIASERRGCGRHTSLTAPPSPLRSKATRGVSASELRLSRGGMPLDDAASLLEAGVSCDSTLRCDVRLRGVPGPPQRSCRPPTAAAPTAGHAAMLHACLTL